MLQFAGLAALLNTVLPEESTIKITDAVSNFFNKKMDTHISEPLNKTFRIGWVNGYLAGVASGAAIVLGGMYWWRRRDIHKVSVGVNPS